VSRQTAGGADSPESQRRPILSVGSGRRDVENSSMLAGCEHVFSTEILSEAQRWGQALWAARNAWDIARRAKGGRHG